MEFKEKFIGFIDILGFKQLGEAVENGTGMSLPELIKILECLGSPNDIEKIKKYGPTLCPQSNYQQHDLDFMITQVSDCVIVSSEVSPAGAIHIINHCWGALMTLLRKGLMCRGYITKGRIYHTCTQFIGSGYNEACSKEKAVEIFKHEANERGTPFVEVDSIVFRYIINCKDKCVEKMFLRMVKGDGETTALFPFQRLTHSFMIGGFGKKFNPQNEKTSNHNMRLSIIKLKKCVMEFVDSSNPDAVKKAWHYIEALNEQLKVCDKTDEIIDMLSSSIFSRLSK